MKSYLLFIQLFLFLFPVDGYSLKTESFSLSTSLTGEIDGYARLLMYSGRPSEVCGRPCKDGFIQFQLFSEGLSCDTIVMVKADKEDINVYGGISLEGYDYFNCMEIIDYGENMFFAVTLRNLGNASGNSLKLFHIDKEDYTLTPVEVVRADSIYATTLPDSLFIWNQELIEYENNFIKSEFYIWKSTDIHSFPTEGRVSVLYDIEWLEDRKYRLYPKERYFIQGSFKL